MEHSKAEVQQNLNTLELERNVTGAQYNWSTVELEHNTQNWSATRMERSIIVAEYNYLTRALNCKIAQMCASTNKQLCLLVVINHTIFFENLEKGLTIVFSFTDSS